MINDKLLLNILHYSLFSCSPILLELLPILLLDLFKVCLMLLLDFELALFLILHVDDELLLLARVIDPLVHLFLVDGKLVQPCLHPHHLKLFLLALELSLHHCQVSVARGCQASHCVESRAHIQGVNH